MFSYVGCPSKNGEGAESIDVEMLEEHFLTFDRVWNFTAGRKESWTNKKSQNPQNTGILQKHIFWDFRRHFLILYGVPEVWEASRNLPGARGSVVLQYEPVATHGDPIQVQNYQNCDISRCPGPCIEHFFLKIISIEIRLYVSYTNTIGFLCINNTLPSYSNVDYMFLIYT